MTAIQFIGTSSANVPMPQEGAVFMFIDNNGQLCCKDSLGNVAPISFPVKPAYMWHLNLDAFPEEMPSDYGNSSSLEWLANKCVEGKHLFKVNELCQWFSNNAGHNGDNISDTVGSMVTYFIITKVRTFTNGVVEYAISSTGFENSLSVNDNPNYLYTYFHRIFIAPSENESVPDVGNAVYNIDGVPKWVGYAINYGSPQYEM